MLLAAYYPCIKALNAAAAVTFVSGVLASAIILFASVGRNGVAPPLIE